MPRRHISEEKANEISDARKENKDKNIEKRLRALALYAEGRSRREISGMTGYAREYVGALVSRYLSQGIGGIVGNKYRGNHRNMSFEEEGAFLEAYKKKAEQGQVIEVGEIKRAYEEKVGHAIGGSQIYYVLRRHGWRKVMPRSKHPNKAGDEAIEASKKLKPNTETRWQYMPDMG
jgi:transposase